MVNAMNNVLRNQILNVTMSFLEDIPIKGCLEDSRDEKVGEDGWERFIVDHITDCKKILERLQGAWLTFSGEKSTFGKSEILVVGHLCGPYG